jgi:flagellar hook-basal body complex protein FliE
MTIEPIGYLPAISQVSPASSAMASMAPADAGAASATRSFTDWLMVQAQEGSSKLARAEDGLQALASGENVSLHHVMISLEEARLGFQLMAQVRNRLLESYQEIMRMQI